MQVDDFENRSGSETSTLSTTSLFLSLYLVLLAFFILLNALSKIEEKKARETMKSINETFSRSEGIDIKPELEEIKEGSIEEEYTQGAYLSGIMKIAKENINEPDIKITTFGNYIRITYPIERFFEPASSRIMGKQKSLLTKIADEVSTIPEGQRMDVDFTIGVDGSQASSPDASNNLSVARSGEFARFMESIGVSQHLISVGIKPSVKGVVKITFYDRNISEAEVRVRPDNE